MSEATIRFVAAGAPPIGAGQSYKVSITQQITELDANRAPVAGGIDKAYRHERTVHVQGQRFAIDPQDIVAVHPPEGSVGDHHRILPCITFSRAALPWEQAAGAGAAPWLALLLFREHDVGGIPQAVPAMVGDLQRNPFVPGPSLPARDSTLARAEAASMKIATYIDANPEWRLMPGEEPNHPCLLVDLPVAQFRALAPTRDDLPWLAHARVVADAQGEHPFSAVLANRTPALGDNLACLVSLQGLAPFLAPASGLPADATHVRLVVLKAWRFRHDEALQGFHRPLSTGPLCVPCAAPDPQARTPEDAFVRNALAMGYTALDHHTRWGDRLASWYRGPLLPFSTEVAISVPKPPVCEDGYVSGAQPLSSADEALRYDPALGMLDASYAAAWQLGRLLALRNKTFSYDLYAWKQQTRRGVFAAGAAAERAGHAERVAPPADEPASGPSADTLFAVLARLIEPALDALAAAGAPGVENPPVVADGAYEPARHLAPKAAAQALFEARDRLKAHVDHAGVKAPPSVVDGLAKLRRLEGVPIDYLVPDERMLPTESLRFFQLDPNWVYCLVEGAYSIARASALDHLQDAATCPHDAYHQVSGFLVRSSLVSEWPGLQVSAEVSDPTAKHRTLRCDRIAPDMLLYLVEVEGPGVVTTVTFQVPSDHIEFHLPAAATWRDAGRSVVDVHALARALDKATTEDFAHALALPPPRPALQWDDRRRVMVLDTGAAPGTQPFERQFVVNGSPFGERLACSVVDGKVELALDDDLPAGTIGLRLRPTGADADTGRWVSSTTLLRPRAARQPVLGYRVDPGHVTAQWPAAEAGSSFETRLRYTLPSSLPSVDVGALARHDAPSASEPVRALVAVGEVGEEKIYQGQPYGQVQLRFRKASKDAWTLPGVWATSTQAFTRLRGPTHAVNQGERGAQVIFVLENALVGQPGYDEIELIVTTDPHDLSRRVHSARIGSTRAVFDLPPDVVKTRPGHWLHARLRGRDDQFISSSWFSKATG